MPEPQRFAPAASQAVLGRRGALPEPGIDEVDSAVIVDPREVRGDGGGTDMRYTATHVEHLGPALSPSGMRSPGLGMRNWGQVPPGVQQLSAAISQPRALQMYQLLDNMEVEESSAISQEAGAL